VRRLKQTPQKIQIPETPDLAADGESALPTAALNFNRTSLGAFSYALTAPAVNPAARQAEIAPHQT